MANFITNSTNDKAVRLEKIISLEIRPVVPTGYELEIQLSLGTMNESIIFETCPTLSEVQALTTPILTALG